MNKEKYLKPSIFFGEFSSCEEIAGLRSIFIETPNEWNDDETVEGDENFG